MKCLMLTIYAEKFCTAIEIISPSISQKPFAAICLHLLLKLYFCLMEVNNELVEKLANLSRLKFDEAQKESIKADLQSMIQFVEKLNELDTTGVAPLLHMSDNVNVLREDEVKGSIDRSEGLKNAPVQDGVFFKVPKVIKKN
jgi:aspartyl-tRNA(Asn)/glutamyl-tRNA(Gln) amidotransferase subunit C